MYACMMPNSLMSTTDSVDVRLKHQMRPFHHRGARAVTVTHLISLVCLERSQYDLQTCLCLTASNPAQNSWCTSWVSAYKKSHWYGGGCCSYQETWRQLSWLGGKRKD